MATNDLKRALPFTLNDFSGQKTEDRVQILGKALPGHVTAVNGQFVTIAFDIDAAPFTLPQVTMPIHTTVYDWIPVQEGDYGVAVPGDVYLGGVSGVGGTADLSRRGNLSTLWFHPIASKAWQPPGGDPNKRVVQGPKGAIVQDSGGKTVVVVDGSNVTITVPSGKTVTVSSGGTAQAVKLADGSDSLVLRAQ